MNIFKGKDKYKGDNFAYPQKSFSKINKMRVLRVFGISFISICLLFGILSQVLEVSVIKEFWKEAKKGLIVEDMKIKNQEEEEKGSIVEIIEWGDYMEDLEEVSEESEIQKDYDFGLGDEFSQKEIERFLQEVETWIKIIESGGGTELSDSDKIPYVREKAISSSYARSLSEKYIGVYLEFNPIYEYTEEYKDIHIGWTKDLQFSDVQLDWIKEAIDSMPEEIRERYPVQGIYTGDGRMPHAAAYASFDNIHLNSVMLDGSNSYYLDKMNFCKVIFHEWAHIIQYYDIFYTFSDEYLDYLSRQGLPYIEYLMETGNLARGFAEVSGWKYEYPEIEPLYEEGYCGNKTYTCPYYIGNEVSPPENPSEDFYLTTDYGATKLIEDMAETFSYLSYCLDGEKFSSARQEWFLGFVEKPLNFLCH